MVVLGRLTRRPEFLRVAGSGRKWATPGLVLQALPREGATGTPGDNDGQAGKGSGPDETGHAGPERPEGAAPAIRLGFTVSRKVGNAVQRNRARRRLRAAAREVVPEAGRPGFDYVIIGRQGTLDRPFAELVGDLRQALAKVNAPGHGPAKPRRPPGQRGKAGKRQPTGQRGATGKRTR